LIDPRPLLSVSSLFGELAKNQSFVNAVQRWPTLLCGMGAKATLMQVRQILKF
jgi:hypothetical protein